MNFFIRNRHYVSIEPVSQTGPAGVTSATNQATGKGDASKTELDAGANKRRDIIGRGVNQTFLLGRGTGIRISEPVYRALPSSMRSPWIRHKPPAIYCVDSAEGLFEGLRKDAASNTLRW